ncbi:MAG: hydrolase [Peptoniphilaceae bacterium]|nr:hydrolase [Peptoniphilaceae bacterium]MDD7383189.1 hydrolase [Peptoniphilaceae bacterium]MDY3738413.1 hydrolase [Peptoniphilaceae bacterium]
MSENIKKQKYIPTIDSKLRHRFVSVPKSIYKCSGISIFNKRIKSLLFTTDVAIIRNANADSIIAVYPYTPQITITQSVLSVASVPCFIGVGGGTTSGQRSVYMALQAELLGAYGVVVNAPIRDHVITEIAHTVDIPVIATISSEKDDYKEKFYSGARILNVSAAKNTAKLVRKIREEMGEEIPIIATGGKTDESIEETIDAGANAITYTPPSSAEVFKEVMETYRK